MIAIDKAGNEAVSNKETIKTIKALTDIYAKLYTDGTLALSSTDVTMRGKTLQTDYGNVKNHTSSTSKWNNDKTSILEVIIIDEIVPKTCSSWFSDCRNLTKITGIENLDTSQLTSMNTMFYKCSSLTELDLSNFNTSNVMYMNAMFYDCSKLTKLNITNFDTSNVRNMNSMFSYCNSLVELDITNFDTSNVTDMAHMFNYCNSLTELDLSNFRTSNVTGMAGMFDNCSSLTNLDVTNFDTTKVTNMQNMFNHCSSLTELDLTNFDTSNVTNMNGMFYYCQKLNSILVSSKWKTATNNSNMFTNCGVSSVTVVN